MLIRKRAYARVFQKPAKPDKSYLSDTWPAGRKNQGRVELLKHSNASVVFVLVRTAPGVGRQPRRRPVAVEGGQVPQSCVRRLRRRGGGGRGGRRVRPGRGADQRFRGRCRLPVSAISVRAREEGEQAGRG